MESGNQQLHETSLKTTTELQDQKVIWLVIMDLEQAEIFEGSTENKFQLIETVSIKSPEKFEDFAYLLNDEAELGHFDRLRLSADPVIRANLLNFLDNSALSKLQNSSSISDVLCLER